MPRKSKAAAMMAPPCLENDMKSVIGKTRQWRLKQSATPDVPVMSWWGRLYSNQGDSQEVCCGNSGFPSDEWELVTESDSSDELEAGLQLL